MLVTLVIASAVWWSIQALAFLRARRALPVLGELPPGDRAEWPSLSIIVPARDEAEHITAALRAKLSDGYPNLEVVLVDDRSSDDTGARGRAIAAADPRVTVTRLDTLPEGWLGKVHAMQAGLLAAKGEWILFSDADVQWQPGTLQRIIAWSERGGIDHVACIPAARAGDRSSTAAVVAFFRLFSTLARLWSVERPDSSASIGAGAFNLVRRSALDRTAGLPWLRMEISDDVALGVMLKRAGARQRAVVARHEVSLELYPSLRVMVRALEKNGASAPMPLVLAAAATLVVLELGWVAGLASPVTMAASAVVGLVAALVQLGVSSWLGLSRWPALMPGLGSLPLAFALARSSVLAFARGGVVWRGTFYPTAVVRAGMRIGRVAAEPAADRRA